MHAPTILDPKSDDAATIVMWSDRRPATIVKRTPKTVHVQRDRAEHFSTPESIESGVPFAQGHGDYVVFTRDYDAPIEVYTLRQTGHWVRQGQPSKGRGNGLWLGVRADYTDPHF